MLIILQMFTYIRLMSQELSPLIESLRLLRLEQPIKSHSHRKD